MKQKVIYFSAIDNLVNASNMFGPALNKHLPVILPLVIKRQALASDARIELLKQALLENGGEESVKMLQKHPLKWEEEEEVKTTKSWIIINRPKHYLFNNRLSQLKHSNLES